MITSDGELVSTYTVSVGARTRNPRMAVCQLNCSLCVSRRRLNVFLMASSVMTSRGHCVMSLMCSALRSSRWSCKWISRSSDSLITSPIFGFCRPELIGQWWSSGLNVWLYKTKVRCSSPKSASHFGGKGQPAVPPYHYHTWPDETLCTSGPLQISVSSLTTAPLV